MHRDFTCCELVDPSIFIYFGIPTVEKKSWVILPPPWSPSCSVFRIWKNLIYFWSDVIRRELISWFLQRYNKPIRLCQLHKQLFLILSCLPLCCPIAHITVNVSKWATLLQKEKEIENLVCENGKENHHSNPSWISSLTGRNLLNQ